MPSLAGQTFGGGGGGGGREHLVTVHVHEEFH